jgi:hypothetical protein
VKVGRCFDEACRGLGGGPSVPTTSVGEENCTMVDDGRYPMENILVHEFAHTVMDVGMSKEERACVVEVRSVVGSELGSVMNGQCLSLSSARAHSHALPVFALLGI